MDISDAAMYFGWFALAFIPFVYLLTYINRKNDPFMEQLNRKESATGNNGSRKPHTHNDTLYNIQQKKPSVGGSMSNTIAATTSAVKSNVGKYQQKQCQQQQQPSRSTNVNKRTDKSYSHPWCLTSLKGHTDQVLDMNFSSNGKYLASCAEDRTLLLWTVNNIGDTQHRKCIRVNVEYDHASHVAWSPDNKALLIHRAIENCIEVIKIEKKDGFLGNPSKGLNFESGHESDVIVGFGIACTGRFIMSCSNKTEIILWSVKGTIMDKLDTCLLKNWSAKISVCGRFIAACGFSPDVKVWEVKFNKSGEYIKTVNVFNLSGHSSGVFDIAFDQDTSHMATVSKDGTWKLFNTKIEYERGQTSRCLITGIYRNSSVNPSIIALTPNGQVIAIASGWSVEIFSGLDGCCDAIIENIYEGSITAILFDPLSKYLLTAGDRHVRVFHNVTGYKINVQAARQKLKSPQTTATRERLEQMIAECEVFLETVK